MEMKLEVKVKLWGSTIGVAMQEEDSNIVSFEYDRNFIQSGIELSPIVMPLSNKIYSFPELNYESFKGLPGLLADSLPDKFGNRVIDKWLAEQGRQADSFSPMERLCYIGSRGMGALEFEPAIPQVASVEDELEIDKLVEFASEILSDRTDIKIKKSDRAMQQLFHVGTSAGGARAKAIIAINEKTGEIRSGQINQGEGFDYWLIKFDGLDNNRDKGENDKKGYCQREYAYYLMALDSGINMSECKLHEESGRHHFMTRRFDRFSDSGEKLHMQTLAAIAHYDFNAAGQYSYEQTALAMRQMGLRQSEIKQLYRRAVFNILSRNQDDHVKNISFLMNKSGEWKLSPAYDVTFAYNPTEKWTSVQQMSLNGKRDNFILNDFIECAEHMDIRKNEALNIIGDVQESLSKWHEYANEAKLSEKEIAYIEEKFRKV